MKNLMEIKDVNALYILIPTFRCLWENICNILEITELLNGFRTLTNIRLKQP